MARCALASFAVAVVTALRSDRERLLHLSANVYITMPVNVQQLAQAVASVAELWFTIFTFEVALVVH